MTVAGMDFATALIGAGLLTAGLLVGGFAYLALRHDRKTDRRDGPATARLRDLFPLLPLQRDPTGHPEHDRVDLSESELHSIDQLERAFERTE